MNLDYNKKEAKGKTPMGRSASDIYEVIKKVRQRNAKRSAELLKEKCVLAVTEMLKSGDLSTEVDIEDEDRDGIDLVVEEMRALGYRHCLIEIQNEEGDLIGLSLRVSLAHLEK